MEKGFFTSAIVMGLVVAGVFKMLTVTQDLYSQDFPVNKPQPEAVQKYCITVCSPDQNSGYEQPYCICYQEGTGAIYQGCLTEGDGKCLAP